MNPTPDTSLSYWQSKQAAMFCYFTSTEYLETLHRMVTALISGVVDPLLETARHQGRDALLVDPQWGTRRTSGNWAKNAWPVLKGLQSSLASSLAERQNNQYTRPSVDQFLRGMNEYSLEWTTPQEEEVFNEAVQKISTMGGWLDDILAQERGSRWDDFNVSYHFPAFHAIHPSVPRFRVRLDVSAETGTVPPVTGVYVALEDPNATLQFAFAEVGGRELRMANTFNDIGLEALAAVGRDALWSDDQKMLEFATSKKYAALFHDKIFLQGKLQPTLAPAAVARAALTRRQVKWYLVEALDELWPADSVHHDTPSEDSSPAPDFSTGHPHE